MNHKQLSHVLENESQTTESRSRCSPLKPLRVTEFESRTIVELLKAL